MCASTLRKDPTHLNNQYQGRVAFVVGTFLHGLGMHSPYGYLGPFGPGLRHDYGDS